MTQKFRNPVKLPLPLLPAEVSFVNHLKEGKPCEVGNGELPRVPIIHGDSHNPANVVRPEVIRFFAYGGKKDNRVFGSLVHLQGAWICGKNPLNLMYASIPYALQFINCHFIIGVEMLRAECDALYLNGSYLAQGLRANGLTTKGNVHMRGLSAKSTVQLVSANIGGNLSCVDGEFHNSNGYALNADKLVTKGSVNLSAGFSAEGGVRLSGANIGGNLVCESGEFVKLKRYALVANGITVKGSVFLNDDFVAEGEVSFLGANIGGIFSCQGGKFHHNPRRKGIALSGQNGPTQGKALTANQMTTGGDVFLGTGFSATGKVNMWGASIGGNFDCAGGKFINPNKYALNAERMKTGGHVFLNKRFSDIKGGFIARGRVRFANADIGRNFNCKGGQFLDSGEKSAIAAAGLRTHGAVFLSEGFVVQGDVDLKLARIGGNFVCNDCGAAKGIIDLSSTKAVAVDDDSNAWKKFEFILDGFTYDTFFGENTPKDKSRLNWLTSRPLKRWIKGRKVEVPFSPLPYEQAAKVLFEMGYASDAREILLEKERLQTAVPQTSPSRRFWRGLWDMFAGYGYRLHKTAYWMAGFILFGAFLFGIAAHHDLIAPHQPAIVASKKYQTALYGSTPMEAAHAAFPDEYSKFSPLGFSLDVFIPFFALHQEPFWTPTSDEKDDLWKLSILLALTLAVLIAWVRLTWRFENRIRREQDGIPGPVGAAMGMAAVYLALGFCFVAGFTNVFLDFPLEVWLLVDVRWLTVWYWIEIAAGWILTSLFLLSVTGLLRPRQSSGGKD